MSLMEFALVNHFMGTGSAASNKPKLMSDENINRVGQVSVIINQFTKFVKSLLHDLYSAISPTL